MLRIELRTDDSYSVRIHESAGDMPRAVLHGLGLAPADARRIALDSPEAYDLIARSALAFASADGHAIYAFADANAETLEFQVSRKRAPIDA